MVLFIGKWFEEATRSTFRFFLQLCQEQCEERLLGLANVEALHKEKTEARADIAAQTQKEGSWESCFTKVNISD